LTVGPVMIFLPPPNKLHVVYFGAVVTTNGASVPALFSGVPSTTTYKMGMLALESPWSTRTTAIRKIDVLTK
jgi:hypothetical protein